MYFFAVCLCLLSMGPLSLGEPLKYKDCGSPDGKIAVVDISPCSVQPCELKKGETFLINVTFSSAVDTHNSTARVHGILAGIHIPFPIPEADGCKSGIPCPIEHGKSYNYVTKMLIERSYPCVQLVVQWELQDDDNKDMFCWQIPVVITN
ncbi:NPC intracellular cholesterol transporter 2 [Ambystoma mexicanum]|uniref:NPC intracellular cholesterol transporter 2 n=1 Tax=Ambystoma mexicanum TaxID=8296 RepID=UPI0037E97299